jgi:hypothetical protein
MDEPDDPQEMSTRRGWLSALARTARSRAAEVSEAVGPGGLPGLLDQVGSLDGRALAVGADAAGTPAVGGREPARAPDRAVSVDELIALAHDEGLTRHDDELRALARRSLRMTSVVPRCAEAWLDTSDAWLDTPGSELLLAQIDLAAALAPGSGLRTEGWLILFARCDADATGEHVVRGHGVLLDDPAAVVEGAQPMALGPETVLPRPWHEAVQAIDFDGTELAAYARLRAQLQELQGVESDDDGGATIAYHRLLGYPDETTGSMPSECEVSASEAGEWRLLAQISIGRSRRAYVWIQVGDLAAGEFSNLRAFVR